MTFTLSMLEIWEYRKRAQCNLPEARGVYGNLGLREWVESALAPVDKGQLKVGFHPRPGGKSALPPPIVKPETLKMRALQVLGPLETARDAVLHYVKETQKAYDEAYETANDSRVRDRTQKTYEAGLRVYRARDAARRELRKVDREAARLLASKLPEDLIAAVKKLQKEAKEATADAGKTKDAVDNLVKDLPHDPPIDALSHSVRFIVAVNGSLSPNWSLVHFRGPTAGGSLLSGSRSRTHTLSIAMGSPQESIRALDNQVIRDSLRSGQ
jgi:hypothetical protein